MLTELFNEFGAYGPVILYFFSIYLLWNQDNLFFYYNVGIFVNAILNLILKGLVQQPRPSEDPKTFHLALTHGKRFLFKDGIPHDIFGMPSGHAQSAFFSTLFIYLSFRKTNLVYIYLSVSMLIMAQRVTYKYHTVLQVLIGAVIGAGFGHFVYFLAREKIKGHITEKSDDYGPI
jgi:membrane-associated phospholipid phosphatase